MGPTKFRLMVDIVVGAHRAQTGVGKVKPLIRRVQEFRLEPRGFGIG